MAKLTYFLVGSVFFGAQILAIDLGIAKLSIYRLMLLIMVISVSILISKNDRRLNFRLGSISKNYTRFFLFWLTYSLISGIWIQNLSGWINGVFFVGTGALSILFISLFIRTEKEIVNIFNVLFSMVLMHNLIGWYEMITGNYPFANLNKLDKYSTFDIQPITRIPISIYANQNDYATMLLAGSAITLILLLISKTMKLKIIYFVTLISSTYLIYRTDSRANVVGIFIAIIAMFLIKYGYTLYKMINKKRIFQLSLFLILVFTLLLLISSSLQESFFKLINSLFTNKFNEGSSNSTRVNLILNGFYFVVKTLGLGVGAGNIEYWMENYSVFPIGNTYNMHNWWIEILTSYGVIIFVLYVIMYSLMIRQLYKQYNITKDNFVRVTSLVILGYMVAFMFSSISSASNIIIEWQWVFWGCIIAFLRYSERQTLNKKKKSSDYYEI